MSTASPQPMTGSYVMPTLEHATVADAMHAGVLSCERDTPLTELARMMAASHVHCIAVTEMPDAQAEESFIWGVISDLDLVRAGVRPGAELTAGAIAHQPSVYVETTTPLGDAARLMLDNDEAHLIVLDPRRRHPIGVLSTLDIAGVLGWGEA